MSTEKVDSSLLTWKNVILVFHIIITALAWVAPFLVSWYLIVPVYLLVMIQFMIFGRCLVNDTHDLEEDGEQTIYSYVLDYFNIEVDKKLLRFYVRRVFYIFLSAVTLFWQLVLGFEPLWF